MDYETSASCFYQFFLTDGCSQCSVISSFPPTLLLIARFRFLVSYILPPHIMDNEFLMKLNIPRTHHAYYNKLNPFLDHYYKNDVDYVCSFKKFINNPQMEFRYYCYKNNETTAIITNKSFPLFSEHEAMFCVFDDYPHVEFILKTTINKLSDKWCHTIVCCPKSEKLVTMIGKQIPNLKIITLKHDINTFNDKNELFTSSYFWGLTNAKKILVYDEQTLILKNNIDDFIEYDFIGAPWMSQKHAYCVGNGAFSLRTREIMLQIVNTFKPRNMPYKNMEIMEHIEKHAHYIPPEDVFFTEIMYEYKIGNLPTSSVASSFSVESVPYHSPFGIHECFNAVDGWSNFFTDAKTIKSWNPTYPFIPRPIKPTTFKVKYELHFNTHSVKTDVENEFAFNLTKMVNNSDQPIGFIMTRHVSSMTTSQYWFHNYKCIRKYYPNSLIVIIDDHTNYSFIEEHELSNVIIINSGLEYCCGEFLPYYYYSQHKFFEQAVIIHDGMFINKFVDYEKFKNMFLFEFYNPERNCENHHEEHQMLLMLQNNSVLIDLHNKETEWKGCFGSCSTVTHEFVTTIEKKYKLSNLQHFIKTRINRSEFERVIAIIFFVERGFTHEATCSIFGSIFDHYKQFEYTFNEFIENSEELHDYGIIKVWSGR